jgi:hypothetical protein
MLIAFVSGCDDGRGDGVWDGGPLHHCEGWDLSARGESIPLTDRGPSVTARVGEDDGVQHVPVPQVLEGPTEATWLEASVSGGETVLSFETPTGPLEIVVGADLDVPTETHDVSVMLAPLGTGIEVTRQADEALLLALHRWGGDGDFFDGWVPGALDMGPFVLETVPSCYVEDGCPRYYTFYDVIVATGTDVLAVITPFEAADVAVGEGSYRVDVHMAYDRSGRGAPDVAQCADITPPAYDVDVMRLDGA